MKKPIAVLTLAMLLGLALGGEITQTLRFDRGRLGLGEQDGYTVVRYGNSPFSEGPGLPALPELPFHLVIPPTATVTGIALANVVEEPLAGEYVVRPVQIGRQWRINDPVPPFVGPNQEVYGSGAIYPKEIVNYQVTGNKGGFRVAGFLVHPVRYSPAERRLYLVTRADVRVQYQERAVAATREFPEQLKFMASDLNGMVSNPEDLRRFAPATKHNGDPSPFLPPGYYEHVIVSPAVYADSFIALRDYRTLQGIPSTIVTIENICGTYPGRDTAEKIRNFIKDARATWGTIFVFLPRWDVPALEHRLAYVSYAGTDNLPCDLYFSDLDGSWDGNHNAIYGECPADSITGYSDVYVGFIPIDNPADVHNFLLKLWRYEKTPPANYLCKVALPVGVTFSQNYSDSIANADPVSWQDWKMYAPGGSEAEFLDSINAGFGYCSGIQHGSVDMLAHNSGNLITSSDALALTNQKLGIFISVGCDPGAWDEVGSVNGDCLAENMVTKAPNAWAAIMFNARSGWIDVAEHYNFQFMYRILPLGPAVCSNQVYVGQGLARAKDHWIPKWNLGGDSSRFRWEAYERNLFGEPAMPLWTAEPGNLTASHSGVITIGSNIPYPVTVNTSGCAPIESALVLLWKGSEVYTKGRTNSSGQVTLYVSPVTPGPMVLTVNAHNYYLLQDTVQVISTARYVSYLRSSLLDPAPGGNGDSILNPGETVKIPTWVKNWGSQNATGVTAKLRTHDANALITDSAKTYGAINAGDSAFTGDNGFGLQVNSGLANGYAIACSLLCRDALDSVWVSNVTFYVGTPVLITQSVTVKDSTHGNGNGKIDPGETSELEIALANTGMGHGYNCWAKLRSGDVRFTIDDSISTYGYIRKGGAANNASNRFLVTASGSIPMEQHVPCTLYTYADGGYVSGPQTFEIIVGEIRSVDPIPDGPRTPALYYAYDDVDVNYPPHPTYNWIELRGRGALLTLSDDQTYTISIPPAFGPMSYYGSSYTQLSICGNGFVAFGSTTTAPWTNDQLPSTTIGLPAICANWDDLYPPDGGGVWWMHDTAAHALVVEWDSVCYYPTGSGRYDKFEIVYFDTSWHMPGGNNLITMQYKTAANLTSSTVGLQDPTIAIAIPCLFNGSYHRGCAALAAGRAIKFCTDLPTPIAEDEIGTAGLKTAEFIAYPNPFRGTGTIAWSVKTEGKVSLKVYDPSGRMIRNLVETSQKPGRYQVAWDGKADDGKTIAAGVYFYKLETASGAHQQKVVVTR